MLLEIIVSNVTPCHVGLRIDVPARKITLMKQYIELIKELATRRAVIDYANVKRRAKP